MAVLVPLSEPRAPLPPCSRYDNEWGYSARFVDVARMVAQSL